MMKFFDNVKEVTSTTGTGPITLGGAAVGSQTFAAVLNVGDSCNYRIDGGSEWEAGQGTLTSSTTLSRDTVESSSNAGALVSFSTGSKSIFLTITAATLTRMYQSALMANSTQGGF